MPEGPKAKRVFRNMKISWLKKNEKRADDIEIYIPLGLRLGETPHRGAQNVVNAFGDNLLFENFNFKLLQSGIVGGSGRLGWERRKEISGKELDF